MEYSWVEGLSKEGSCRNRGVSQRVSRKVRYEAAQLQWELLIERSCALARRAPSWQGLRVRFALPLTSVRCN